MLNRAGDIADGVKAFGLTRAYEWIRHFGMMKEKSWMYGKWRFEPAMQYAQIFVDLNNFYIDCWLQSEEALVDFEYDATIRFDSAELRQLEASASANDVEVAAFFRALAPRRRSIDDATG